MLELASLYAELRKCGLTRDHLRAYCVHLVLAQDITARELVAEVVAFSERPTPPTITTNPSQRTLRVAAVVKYLEDNGVTIFTTEMVAGTASKLPGGNMSRLKVAREISALGYTQVLNGEQVRTCGKLRRMWAKAGTAIASKDEAIAAFETPYAIWHKLWDAGYPGLEEGS